MEESSLANYGRRERDDHFGFSSAGPNRLAEDRLPGFGNV